MSKNNCEIQFENCLASLCTVISKSHAEHVIKIWRQLQNDFNSTIDLPQVAFGNDEVNENKTIVLSWSNKRFYFEIEIFDDVSCMSFIRDRKNDIYAGDNERNCNLNEKAVMMFRFLNEEFKKENEFNTTYHQCMQNQLPMC